MCVVRVVHSLFASTDDWDDQLEGIERGWPDYFRILALYLTHYPGLVCAAFQHVAATPGPAERAWQSVAAPLGLAGAAVGARVLSAPGLPALAGVVEGGGTEGHPHQVLLRLDRPAPGLAHLFALGMGPQVFVCGRFYLYGDGAAAAASREAEVWKAWIEGGTR